MNVIIFSKDRAAQLDALIRSIREQVEDFKTRGRWAVIHTASSDALSDGYSLLKEKPHSADFNFVDEREDGRAFKQIVVETMREQHEATGDPHCMFLVDDNVFKAPLPRETKQQRVFEATPEILCLSLRMQPGYDFSHPMNKRGKKPGWPWSLEWRWPGAKGDWGYPMSVDGHLFRFSELMPIVEACDFKNPNSFEAELARRANKKQPWMICMKRAPVVNLPVNIVQSTFKNRAGEEHAISVEELNNAYLAGKRVALGPIYALGNNRGPHHEMPIELEPVR